MTEMRILAAGAADKSPMTDRACLLLSAVTADSTFAPASIQWKETRNDTLTAME